MDNLPELRDIHLPEDGISFFPPAYGWWLLPLLVAALFVAVRFVLWLRKTSKRVYARRLLKKNAAQNTLAAAVCMSELLRRICVSRYPEAVSLTGKNWTDFLNNRTSRKLPEKTAQLLETAPYLPADSTMFSAAEVADLRQFCLAFIGDNL